MGEVPDYNQELDYYCPTENIQHQGYQVLYWRYFSLHRYWYPSDLKLQYYYWYLFVLIGHYPTNLDCHRGLPDTCSPLLYYYYLQPDSTLPSKYYYYPLYKHHSPHPLQYYKYHIGHLLGHSYIPNRYSLQKARLFHHHQPLSTPWLHCSL